MSLSNVPIGSAISDAKGKLTSAWQALFEQLVPRTQALYLSGPTGSRPTSGLYLGMQYLDTTLGKPVFLRLLSPPTWIDATGSIV